MTEPGNETAADTTGRARLRASNADRDQAIDALKVAFVQGRLDKDEFDARVGQAFTSRTYAELAAVTVGIPAGPTAAPAPHAPARPQGRATVRTSIKTGACAIAAATTLVAATLGLPWPGIALMIVAALVFGVIVAGVVALPIAGVLMLESRRRKRSGGQLPPRSASGAGGPTSRRPASGAWAEQLPQADHRQQHTAEAAPNDRGGSQPSRSGQPDGRRPRGRRYAIGYAGH